jgi:hypothetical protein
MAQVKGLENLVNIPCPLDKAHAQLIPESIRGASEIQRQRIKDKSLRSEWFITGDGCVYNVEGSQAVLYFTDTALNPVLKQDNIADAVSQIRQNGNYKVKADNFSLIQKEAAKKNGGAKHYALSDLGLTKYDSEWSFFEIDTKKHDKLNKAQRALAEQVHGKGKQFVKTMEMFSEAGISKTRIYVLNPEYVQNMTKDGPVARVGGLDGFYYDGDFGAGDGDVDDDIDRVRGVRRDSVAEGDAAKIITFDYDKAYDALLAKPEEALEHLNKKRAAGLLDLANKFYQKQ